MKTLLLIVKIILLVTLIPLSLFSIIGYVNGDYITATIVFLLTGIPVFFIIRNLSKNRIIKEKYVQNKHIENVINDMTITNKEINKDYKEIDNSILIYFSKMLKGESLQLLESLDIIKNTTRLDTLFGRINFVNKIYPNLKKASNYDRYISDIQVGMDRFKTMYYDKMLQENQVSLLVHPDEYSLKKYFSDCILECYKRYVEKQKTEMLKLVRISAYEKRKDELIKQGYTAKHMFEIFDLPNSGQLEEIEEIRKQFY